MVRTFTVFFSLAACLFGLGRAAAQESPLDPSTGAEGRRHIIAVGYQIGGYNLIGGEYQMRLHDYFGAHIGGGLLGAAAGLNVFFSPSPTSPCLSLGVKDGGFGQIDVVALDLKGTWFFGSSWGLNYVVGAAALVNISEEMEDTLFKGDAPPVMPSLGLGVGFRI